MCSVWIPQCKRSQSNFVRPLKKEKDFKHSQPKLTFLKVNKTMCLQLPLLSALQKAQSFTHQRL